MTSTERHEQRYQRRKAQRQERRWKKYRRCDNFDCVFSYGNLYRAYMECRRGVSWKGSVQSLISEAPLRINKIYHSLHKGSFKSKGFVSFDICERGKQRHIRSIDLDTRIVQRCLCNDSLVPVLTRKFIYDNGAAIRGKGYTFAVNRAVRHLRQYYRAYGTDGYILLFDFSKFFDSISHGLLKSIIQHEYSDDRIVNLLSYFIDEFGDVGIGLGSQISQILALAAADRIDHTIKEQLHIRYYGRYMDDGYLIHSSKSFLIHCLGVLKRVCSELGIIINWKKTQIIKLSRGFTFLKVRFNLTRSGKIIRRVNRRSVNTMKHKLRSLSTSASLDDITTSFNSWSGYMRHFNAHRTYLNMLQLYRRINLSYT